MSSSDTVAATNTSPGVGPEQALAFLREHLDGDVSDLAAPRQGAWSSAYTFRHAGRDLVVRFSRHADDFERDRLAGTLASPEMPAPTVLELGEALGGFYAISERASGGYLDELDADGMRATLPSLFAALDAMRTVELPGTRGFGTLDADGNGSLGSWREMLLMAGVDDPAGRLHGWRTRMETSPVGAAMFDQALAELERLIDQAPEARHLVHSDLLNYNVLVAGTNVSAVLDWGCAFWGDFLYDVAWLVFFAPWYPAWKEIDFAAEAKAHFEAIGLNVPDFDARLRLCLLHIGLTNQSYCAGIGRWDQLDDVGRRTLAILRADAG